MASEPLKHTWSGSMVQNVAGRPEPDSGPGPDLPAVWISPQTHQKYTVVYSELIRSLLATSYASLTIIGTSDVPGLVSDPGPDLSTKWISPQIHKKYTGVYFELIRSLLATFYASLTIIGASDVRDWYLIRGRICPPNGYLLKYTKSTRAYTLS